METLKRIRITRAEMMKRVARFDQLRGSDEGLPDSRMPGYERTLFNVIGFQPPAGAEGATVSPVGYDASRRVNNATTARPTHPRSEVRLDPFQSEFKRYVIPPMRGVQLLSITSIAELAQLTP